MRCHKVLLGFLLLAGCAGTPAEGVRPQQTPEIFSGTALGDPCTPDGMHLDFPPGLPRLCVAGKWLPLCSSTADAQKYAVLCTKIGEPKNVD